MKLVKFSYKGKIKWGRLIEERIDILKDPYRGIAVTRASVSLSKVKLLVPAQPSKIILAGLNYRDHAQELNMQIPQEPVIFLKPATSLIAHEEKIVYPHGVARLDYEGELALVIKKQGRNISEKKAKDYILGYTCLNDVTARDLQKKDGQWTRAKSFDTFCPVGPWLETSLDVRGVRVETFVNGIKKQDSSTRNFIFTPGYLVSFISHVMTLLPGDIISTGTPQGVGSLKKKDKVEVRIEGVGNLINFVS